MSAAAQLPVSVSEYLDSSYRPDCDANIWIIDPGRRCGFDFSSGQWRDTGLHLELSALFTSIDQDLL